MDELQAKEAITCSDVIDIDSSDVDVESGIVTKAWISTAVYRCIIEMETGPWAQSKSIGRRSLIGSKFGTLNHPQCTIGLDLNDWPVDPSRSEADLGPNQGQVASWGNDNVTVDASYNTEYYG